MKIIFFGSTTDSVLILNALKKHTVLAVVTPPARPVGRHKTVTPTPVESCAQKNIPIESFDTQPDKPWLFRNEQDVINKLQHYHAELIISASFGQKIPSELLKKSKFGGINVHPSLLPRWRGGDPVPWAILVGDQETGITVQTLGESFDKGNIISQQSIPIQPTDTSNPLRATLFQLGAEHLKRILQNYPDVRSPASPAGRYSTPDVERMPTYARRFTREDGFLPWELILAAMQGEKVEILEQCPEVPIIKDFMKFQPNWKSEKSLGTVVERFFRALVPWPGIWTKISINNYELRMKIISCHLNQESHSLNLDTVQLEGKNPVPYTQFRTAYHIS